MLGYAGRNNKLRDKKETVRCNRGMRKKTWEDKGLSYAGELAEKNFKDLLKILKWNKWNGIGFYRCTSKSFVPWNSQYKIKELPNIETIKSIAKECGQFVIDNDMRLSYHPDYFVKPASKSEDTRNKARKSLENHGSWLDLMELPKNNKYPINIHIGGHYGNKQKTSERLYQFVDTLSDSVTNRLVFENDDNSNLWSVKELSGEIYNNTGIPVTFDYHHHTFSYNGLTYREGFDMAKKTWNCKPVTHYSEPAILHDEKDADKPQTHAKYVSNIPTWLIEESDVMIECNGKEQALDKIQKKLSPRYTY
jgi:UV DNA damage endonuclease